MLKNPCFYILQPELDQAVSIARLIKRGHSNAKIVGVLLIGQNPEIDCVYAEVIVVESYTDLDSTLFIIPTGAASTEALLKARDVRLHGIVMTSDALNVYDKKKFLAICEQSGLPVPKTFYSAEDIPVAAFPIFFKQSHEKGGGSRGVAWSRDEIPIDGRQDLIFQEYIESKGTYGVGFIADQGQILVSHAHFERESFPRSGGSAVIVERVQSSELILLTEKIVASLNYCGWGLAEFKYDPVKNRFVFMEVNAKFWASCDFAFKSNSAFGQILFGVDVVQRFIKRQVYLNRALTCGPVFILRNLPALLLSDRVVYKGVLRDLARGLLSDRLKRILRGRKVVDA